MRRHVDLTRICIFLMSRGSELIDVLLGGVTTQAYRGEEEVWDIPLLCINFAEHVSPSSFMEEL